MPSALPPVRPRILVVSNTYLARENRKKLYALQEHADITCAIPAESRSPLGAVLRPDRGPEDQVIRLITLPALGSPSTVTRYVLRGLQQIFREQTFDIILVEAEPWAWLRWQVWWCRQREQPAAVFGEFTWENLRRPGWRGWILDRVYQAAVATADFVIAGNEGGRDLLVRAGLPARRLLVSPQLGFDETAFLPVSSAAKAALRETRGLAPQAFVVGFCGRFVAEKGVLDLVAAIEEVRVRAPAADVMVALIGAGPLLPQLQEMAQQREWLRLLPPCNHLEVAGFMQMLDLFVLPSRPVRTGRSVWEEQFGHVLVEAMACGVACLGSDSGAIPQVVDAPQATFPQAIDWHSPLPSSDSWILSGGRHSRAASSFTPASDIRTAAWPLSGSISCSAGSRGARIQKS